MKLSVFILSAASVVLVTVPGLERGQEEASLRRSHCDECLEDSLEDSLEASLRTSHCGECLEITVSSTAGAAQRHPHMMGVYTLTGDYLWEDRVPSWRSATEQYISLDPGSQPQVAGWRWLVSAVPNSYQEDGIMEEFYQHGCPHDETDHHWMYLDHIGAHGSEFWLPDPTLEFTCTKTRDQWLLEQN